MNPLDFWQSILLVFLGGVIGAFSPLVTQLLSDKQERKKLLWSRQLDKIDKIEENVLYLNECCASNNFSSIDQNELRDKFKQTQTMGYGLRKYPEIMKEFYNFITVAGIIAHQGGRTMFETVKENENAVANLDASCDKLTKFFDELRKGNKHFGRSGF